MDLMEYQSNGDFAQNKFSFESEISTKVSDGFYFCKQCNKLVLKGKQAMCKISFQCTQ